MSVVPEISTGLPPVHVAIIMDGNGRWARKRGLVRAEGHRKGAEAVRRTIKASIELGIQYLTLFGFSSENWRRSQEEVGDLMALLRWYLKSEIAELHRNGIRLRVFGGRSRMPSDIVKLIENAEEMTKQNRRLSLNIALNYGARQELVDAARELAKAVAEGRIAAADINEELFDQFLETHGIPDPDLMIRSSGEQRLSNFLLWQSAYTELCFVDTLWPDFERADLERAIEDFQRRERRYGAALGSL